jgi:hypothetical protein
LGADAVVGKRGRPSQAGQRESPLDAGGDQFSRIVLGAYSSSSDCLRRAGLIRVVIAALARLLPATMASPDRDARHLFPSVLTAAAARWQLSGTRQDIGRCRLCCTCLSHPGVDMVNSLGMCRTRRVSAPGQ